MRILLVEDEPQAAKMLAKGLREETYAVDLVNNGKSAMYQAAITEYDAIILDVMLPCKTGSPYAVRSAGKGRPSRC
jgi:DNA-binding response OmpR family regulator